MSSPPPLTALRRTPGRPRLRQLLHGDKVTPICTGDRFAEIPLRYFAQVMGHILRHIVQTGPSATAFFTSAKSDPSAADVAAVNQRMIQGETGFGSYNFYGDNKFIFSSRATQD